MRPFLLLFLFFSNVVIADSIRTSDGITCSFDSDDKDYEVRAFVEGYDNGGDYLNNGLFSNKPIENYNISSDSSHGEIKGGIELTYKFGGPERLNCNKLYLMELREKELKLQQLEAKIKKLEAVGNINWN